MKLVSTFSDYFDGRGNAFRRTGGNVGPQYAEVWMRILAAWMEMHEEE